MGQFHKSQNVPVPYPRMHISVLNGAFWDMEQVHSGISELGQLSNDTYRVSIKRRLAVGAWQIGSGCALSETFNQPFNSRKNPSLSRLIKFDISETGKSKECN